MKQFTNLLIVISLVASALLIAQDKPLLSEAIHEAIDEQGIDEAKKHFAKLYESKKDHYEIDMGGISALSSAYAQDNNIEAAGAVMEIATPYMQYLLSASMSKESNEMIQMLAEKERKEEEEQQKNQEKEKSLQENNITNYQGEARSGLERFIGLYGDQAESNENRRLWVTVSCDGYLVSGALWGDVAPWWMKSESDNVFTYADSFSKVRMEFETDTNGKAIRMIHNLSYLKTPLKRLGPIPNDWDPCLERPKR
jgi:hypothetical protein